MLVHRQISNAVAFLFHGLAGMQHRMMLNGAGDDMLALLLHGFAAQTDGPVVAFAAASGKVHFPCFRADGVRHLLAGSFHSLASLAANAVNGTGITVSLGKERQHGLQYFGTGGGGRRIIHIDHMAHIKFPHFRRVCSAYLTNEFSLVHC